MGVCQNVHVLSREILVSLRVFPCPLHRGGGTGRVCSREQLWGGYAWVPNASVLKATHVFR